MTSSIRYKFVKNHTVSPLTIDNFANNCMITNDGDDRQYKFVKRIITIADIGTDPGELGNSYGAIVDVIPPGYNVLWFQTEVFRPGNILVGPNCTYYNNIGSDVEPLPDPTTQTSVNFILGADNTLRVNDKGHAGASALVVGDIITAFIVIGYSQFSQDVMNPIP